MCELDLVSTMSTQLVLHGLSVDAGKDNRNPSSAERSSDFPAFKAIASLASEINTYSAES